jgi:proteasome lid subunit RPN8/RPN11
MAKGKSMTKLHISPTAIEETLKSLKRSARRNSEGIVLWLGRRAEPTSSVSRVYEPIHTAAADFFHIPKQGMAHMLALMGENDVSVLAQVHSHPQEAFHSEADDQWAIVRHLGALSLVLPDFARDATIENFMQLAATYRLDERNRWSRVSAHHLCSVLEVRE